MSLNFIDRNGTPAPTTYVAGYLKGPDDAPYVRLLSPYMGETHATLEDAKAHVADEDLNDYMAIVYFEIRPIEAAQ